jgi:hypothetical protein
VLAISRPTAHGRRMEALQFYRLVTRPLWTCHINIAFQNPSIHKKLLNTKKK